MSIENKLLQLSFLVDSIAEDVKESSKNYDILELLSVLKELDEQYRDWCSEIDDEYEEEIGTTYENGISLEYYIEAETMHTISKLLRKIK